MLWGNIDVRGEINTHPDPSSSVSSSTMHLLCKVPMNTQSAHTHTWSKQQLPTALKYCNSSFSFDEADVSPRKEDEEEKKERGRVGWENLDDCESIFEYLRSHCVIPLCL